MSPEELRQLLVREDERLEWKRSSRDVSELLQAVCALANDLGNTRRPGVLLIGVEKNGAVSGVEARSSELDNEQRILSDRLRSVKLWPTPSFDIHVVEYEGKNVFAVQVAPYAVPPIVTVDAVAWVRQGSTTRRATEADIQRLRERRPENHHPFDFLGPNLGALNRAALLACDAVIIPVAPDLFSLQGLADVGPILRDWRQTLWFHQHMRGWRGGSNAACSGCGDRVVCRRPGETARGTPYLKEAEPCRRRTQY